MEKKVPERKVSLQENDVFYVYDKRINKCVKEGCEGTVKYGLVLRVSVVGEETCNCFECNKCHMKYTPYPNYVRLTKPELLTIYNQEEVTARDEKRAEDARKQALKEKREKEKSERKSFERKSYDKKPYEKKAFGDKPYERKSYDKKPYERKSFGDKTYEKKSYGDKTYEKKAYDHKPYDRNSSEHKSYDHKSYDHKPYEKSGYRKYGNVVITRGSARNSSYTNTNKENAQ